MIEIEWDDRRITQALRDLQRAAGNLNPALIEIREVLIESTQKRFVSKTGPDGKKWANNSDVTIELKGTNDPLVDGGYLNSEIAGDVIGGHTLEIYSTKDQAAMMQFGGTKAEFPHLWGDIPARPFLGISFEDDAEIMSIINNHLENAIKLIS